MSANKPLQVLIVSKGHAYDHSAFLAMFEDFDDLQATLVEHPAAEIVLGDSTAGRWDVVFFYDMCGVPGMSLAHDGSQGSGRPTAGYERAIEALVKRGTGLLLANHATVSWANWSLWRDITGSSFMLTQGELRGETLPGSGYRGGHGPLPNATVPLHAVVDHPVVQGLPAVFEISDELYLKTDRYGPLVQPLLRADYVFEASNFSPPPLAPPDEQAQWSHPPGSNVLVWANAVENSPVVVSDLGDGPAAYGHPAYRQLIANACRWLASAGARAWAQQQTA